MKKEYAAHIRDDEKIQSIIEHCIGTAIRAKGFAEEFGSGDYGYFCGLLHDIGKYSQQFQKRIRGSSQRVNHSSAGAIECNKAMPNLGWLFSYCIAGHHGGLPDGGSKVDTEVDPTLHGRLKQTNLPDYSDFKTDINIISVLPKITRPFTPQ